jgi:hypothetical protein
MTILWQHRNGDLYAVKHDTFGHIVGVAGPLDWEDLGDPDEYSYRSNRIEWAENAIRRRMMHKVHPAAVA